jgi:hypothetical protein
MNIIILETPGGELERITAPDSVAACIAAADLILRCGEMHDGDHIRIVERTDLGTEQ